MPARRVAWWVAVFAAFYACVLWVETANPQFAPQELLVLVAALIVGLLVGRWSALLVFPIATLVLWVISLFGDEPPSDDSTTELVLLSLSVVLIADAAVALGIALRRAGAAIRRRTAAG
jgi:hypothetical protein